MVHSWLQLLPSAVSADVLIVCWLTVRSSVKECFGVETTFTFNFFEMLTSVLQDFPTTYQYIVSLRGNESEQYYQLESVL